MPYQYDPDNKFGYKDTLESNHPEKIIKGKEFDDEFNKIASYTEQLESEMEQIAINAGGIEEAPFDQIAYARQQGDWTPVDVVLQSPDAGAYIRKDVAQPQQIISKFTFTYKNDYLGSPAPAYEWAEVDSESQSLKLWAGVHPNDNYQPWQFDIRGKVRAEEPYPMSSATRHMNFDSAGMSQDLVESGEPFPAPSLVSPAYVKYSETEAKWVAKPDLDVEGNLSVDGTIDATGDISTEANLNVIGNITGGGDLTINGGNLIIDGGSIVDPDGNPSVDLSACYLKAEDLIPDAHDTRSIGEDSTRFSTGYFSQQVYALDGNSDNWNEAHGWGNHADAGYLTAFTEIDPVFSASPAASITSGNISNWNTAHGWGNHATAGYSTYDGSDAVKTSGNQTIGGIKTFNSDIRAKANVYAYYGSDERLKDDIAPMPLGLIDAVEPATWKWKEDGQASGGVIAQQLQKAGLDDWVREAPNGDLGVDYNALIGALIAEVLDLKRRLADGEG